MDQLAISSATIEKLNAAWTESARQIAETAIPTFNRFTAILAPWMLAKINSRGHYVLRGRERRRLKFLHRRYKRGLL